MAGRRSAAVLLLMVAVACTASEDRVVTIFGPEIGPELAHFEQVLADLAAEEGITIEVEGTRDFENEIGSRLAASDPPDVAMFPQPARLREVRDQAAPLSTEARNLVRENFDESITGQVAADLIAVPVKIDLKSLVWYSPAHFEQYGYEVPTTFDEFLALADRMREEGHPPFCVGLESGEASGWPATDWVEDFMLRAAGTTTYDRWVNHAVAFHDPEIVDVAQMVFDRWSQDGYILGGTDAALATSFTDAGWPVLDGACMMHRQANFYSLFWPEGTSLGEGGEVDAFPLPGAATLTGGLFAVPFSEDDDVATILRIMAGERFARAMAGNERGGFLSPSNKVQVEDYANPLSRTFAVVLQDALDERPESVRFDASDQMPGAVGTGTFWTAMIDITSGSEDVATAFGEVEANWPS